MNREQVNDELTRNKITVDDQNHLASIDETEEVWVYTDYTNARVVTVVDAHTDGIQLHILSYDDYMKRDEAAHKPGGRAIVDYITDMFFTSNDYCDTCGQPIVDCLCTDY